MRLSELVSTLTPAVFTIVALLIFFVVFVAIAFQTMRPGARAEHQRALELPLHDDAPTNRRGGEA